MSAWSAYVVPRPTLAISERMNNNKPTTTTSTGYNSGRRGGGGATADTSSAGWQLRLKLALPMGR